MAKLLSPEQIDRYQTQGAIAPIRIMDTDAANRYREQFEALERDIGKEAQSQFRIKAHLPFPWLTELIHNETMLDAVEDLIGPDIMV